MSDSVTRNQLQIPSIFTMINNTEYSVNWLPLFKSLISKSGRRRKMKFDRTNLKGLKMELRRLDDWMKNYGLIRSGQWDYERVTYDRKIIFNDETFYLRVQGYAVDGDVGTNRATIELLAPILGKHIYHQGLIYHEEELLPATLIHTCKNILSDMEENLLS